MISPTQSTNTHLPDELLSKIFKFLPTEDLWSIERVNRQFNRVVSQYELWKTALKKDLNIKILNSLGSGLSWRKLALAGIIACRASENGMAAIATLSAGWSFEQLQAVSQAAVAGGIPSAEMTFKDGINKALIVPIKEDQTIVLTHTIIHGSREHVSTLTQSLKARGLEEEFPDALVVLTMAVFMRIATHGQESLYDQTLRKTYTFCSQIMGPEHQPMHHWVMGSDSSGIKVSYNCGLISDSEFDPDFIGVGGQRRFVQEYATVPDDQNFE